MNSDHLLILDAGKTVVPFDAIVGLHAWANIYDEPSKLDIHLFGGGKITHDLADGLGEWVPASRPDLGGGYTTWSAEAIAMLGTRYDQIVDALAQWKARQ